MFLAVKVAQVFPLEFADAMLGGNCATHFHCMAHELPINLSSLLCLPVIVAEPIALDCLPRLAGDPAPSYSGQDIRFSS